MSTNSYGNATRKLLGSRYNVAGLVLAPFGINRAFKLMALPHVITSLTSAHLHILILLT